ncbi:MAG: DsbA family protein [Gammaproteobacteria bacterium]|nr:DsbA family protein [Gammaproteobacteria bacterium]
MNYSVDVFWSFRSPYCYFALDRLLRIHRSPDAVVRLRPVYPMAVRDPGFFKRTSPLYRDYHTLDSKRVADYLGLPFRRPVPDPIVQDPQTHEFAREQPYIFRLTRLGAAAQMAGRAVEFADRVSRLLWDGRTDNWHEGEHLARALTNAGLDAAAVTAEVENDPGKFDDLIEANQRDHAASGHWGVPTMVFEGEPFYGQDRIELLLWRMRRSGFRLGD